MDDFTRANQLLILSAGRRPAWVAQASAQGNTHPPTVPSDGAALSDAVVTAIKVDLRENVAFRTTRVTISTLDLAANYTVTVDGHAVTVNGPFGSRAALIDALVTAINADGTVGAIVSASPEQTPHAVLKLEGLTSTDYSLTGSATGSGVLAFAGDAGGATALVYGIEHDTTGTLGGTWAALSGYTYTIAPAGLSGRLVTGGYDQIYVRLASVTRVTNDNSGIAMNPAVYLGPCGTE